MSDKKSTKVKKTLHMPAWVCDLLDHEGSVLGGRPGKVASAAILMFAEADPAHKAECIRRIHDQEVTDAYRLANQDGDDQGGIDDVARRIIKDSNRQSARETPDEARDEAG